MKDIIYQGEDAIGKVGMLILFQEFLDKRNKHTQIQDSKNEVKNGS